MLNLFISPENYISGYDNLKYIGKTVRKLSEKVLILSDEKIYKIIDDAIISFEKEGVFFVKEYFNGECSHQEAERLKNRALKENCTAIIGFGGGKIMDTVKATGYKAGLKIITVPTIAGTCAAWSSHSAMYTEQGIAYEYYNIEKNPDLLYLDKKLIFEAPERYIISGMIDTLAKWVETEAYTKDLKEKTTQLEIAIQLAKKTFNEIFEYGDKVIKDIKAKKYTKEVEEMIENVIFTAGLIGGIGGEACRSVAAHAVNNGFTVLTSLYNKNLHGEVVGFGNLVQMALDKKDNLEIKALKELYKSWGAPYDLKTLFFEDLSEVEMERIINKALYKGDTIWNLSYVVSFEDLKAAIYLANKI